MLHLSDATAETDRRIAALLGRESPITGIPPYTTGKSAVREFRSIVEEQDCKSRLKATDIEGKRWFSYSCSNHQGPIAQGLGQTAALAICDAFIKWAENIPSSGEARSVDTRMT